MTPELGRRLEERVAMVVRAGSPFGRAVVERFRAEGARTIAYEGDGDDARERRAAVGAAFDAHGALDILVIPPPLVVGRPFLEADPEEDRADVNAAVRTTFFLVQEAARAMGAGGRCCIAGPKRSGSVPNDMPAPATMLEGALIALTRLVAVELAPRGVAINAVCPVGPDADPADVAGSLAFLASDDASYVLGAFVPVLGRSDTSARTPPSDDGAARVYRKE